MSPAFRVPGKAFFGRLSALALSAWMVAQPAAMADGQPPDQARPLPALFGGAFTLVDHEGRARTDRDFLGRFLLVFFGYTYCPDICPTDLQTISTALDMLEGDGKRVQPVFISVDPARDTPTVLKPYVANFHPSLIGLTGSESQVRAAARAFRVHRSKVIVPDMPTDEYLVNHTSITYLMGPDGKFVTLFPHGTEAAVMAEALRRYITEATPS